jgi:hypothetical protein
MRLAGLGVRVKAAEDTVRVSVVVSVTSPDVPVKVMV